MKPTPPCPADLQEFSHSLCEVDLVCHLEYIPEIKGSKDSWGANYEPDEDERMILWACYVEGTDKDIASLLDKFYIKELEIVALNGFKDYS